MSAKDAIARWLHEGGWVHKAGGCTLTVSGVDAATREPYHHVIDWQGCENRAEHEEMASDLAYRLLTSVSEESR